MTKLQILDRNDLATDRVTRCDHPFHTHRSVEEARRCYRFAEQAEREAACGHAALTPEYVEGELAKCYRYWDSTFAYMTCTACGWQGYPEVEDDEVVFYDGAEGSRL
jgi:hypothetical protein